MQNKVKLGFVILLLLLGMSAGSCGNSTPAPPALVANPEATPTIEITQRYQEPDDYTISIIVSGMERTFLLHVPPAYQPGIPVSLVFNLHGAGGTAHQQANKSHMNAKADEEGFLVVYPQALHEPSTWLGPFSGPASQNDNQFFANMIEYLQTEMSIDPARIYATGISNGGTMANHLGCIMSDVFAAIAPVSAGNATYTNCQIEKPVSVTIFHGTADSIIPYAGDARTPAVQAWAEAWSQQNGCDPNPSTIQFNTRVQQETWQNCAGESAVTFYTIEGGLHDWPGEGFGPGPWPNGLSPDIYATDVIWEFFEAHPKSDEVLVEPSIDPALLTRYQSPGDYVDMLPVDGYNRWFIVHIPPQYTPETPLPLVLNIHPYGSTMFDQEEISNMKAKADEAGFIVVNPQALGDPPVWYGPLPGLPGQTDKDFFVAMLDYLQALINIDPARIYATGFSNGATMTNALGCFMSDTFAAIAPVAGGHTDFTNCPIEQPVSVLVIHGTGDSTIPYDGRANEVPPVHLWVEQWAERNGCENTSTASQPTTDTASETWTSCTAGAEVQLLTRQDGGHIWPGSSVGYFFEGSESSINATDIIWAFFEKHPKQLVPQE